MTNGGYYPVKQNSLEAQITSGIIATDTSIAVDYCEYLLPDGWDHTDVSYVNPVLAVISPDNSDYTYPETIRITAMSASSGAGTITVTRGYGATAISGYARVWGTSTKIAVVMTAQHIAQIQDTLKSLAWDQIIGVKWDSASASPALTNVDLNGETLTLTTADFDRHPVWGQMWRLVKDRATGEETYGQNARGDGLTLDGSAGDVLVRDPAFYAKPMVDGTDRYWWVSPGPVEGFSLHPKFLQRGGAFNPEVLTGAYEAYGYLDGAFKLGSATGKQPVTGEVAYPDLPNTGRLTIDDAELYANNIGAGFGCMNYWNYVADQLLFYIEYANFDSQALLGRGITDLDSGIGFAGKNTGVDGVDANISTNGTGTGTGLDGVTPVVWRGKENLWGNSWSFVIGANLLATGEYRLINRDGSGLPAGWMADGDYESGLGVSLEYGYMSDILVDSDLSKLSWLGSGVLGGSNTYFCDWWIGPSANRIFQIGGSWDYSSKAGIACKIALNSPDTSGRQINPRIEYYPEAIA